MPAFSDHCSQCTGHEVGVVLCDVIEAQIGRPLFTLSGVVELTDLYVGELLCEGVRRLHHRRGR